MGKSSIEWTDETWNPVRGCSILSKGCTNCYAMRQAHRSSGKGGAYEGLTKLTKAGPVWTGEVREIEALLTEPLHWQRPRRVFVNSMSDLFHEEVHGDFIDAVMDTIKRCHHLGRGHVFQVLTKRAERMNRLMRYYVPPIPNLWLGVSVEDRAQLERADFLRVTPAAVRFLSLEPLLEDLGPIDLAGIDWVIVGGESGPGARPMHPEWVRNLRDQCASAGVPFFFKQWGAWAHLEQVPMDTWAKTKTYTRLGDVVVWRAPKKANGRFLDGQLHSAFPASGVAIEGTTKENK